MDRSSCLFTAEMALGIWQSSILFLGVLLLVRNWGQLGSRSLDLFFFLSVPRATASAKFMAMGTAPTLRNLEAIVRPGFLPSRQPAFRGRTSNGTRLALANGVSQVAHLRAYSKDVSGCNTAPYEFFPIVRNEEVVGSNPISSTKPQRFPTTT